MDERGRERPHDSRLEAGATYICLESAQNERGRERPRNSRLEAGATLRRPGVRTGGARA